MQRMDQSGIVCVFAKAPLPGAVKTRLARTIGAERAAAFAEAFLLDTLELVLALPKCRVVAAVTPEEFVPPLVGECWSQGEGDLGQKLERVAQRALQEAPWILFLGTDSPGLPRRRLDQARSWLEDPGGPQAVLGPAEDGGYYALGLRRAVPLDGVRWSTGHALSDTLAAVDRAGMRHRLLEPWFDVDTAADLARAEELLSSGSIHALHTQNLLRELKEDASRHR